MATTYETKTIEHLGLVAGMFDELGIGEMIDQLLAQDKEQRIVTIGQAVKAMVLNGLGFTNRRLYLTSRFFENKPTDRLIGEGIQAEHLNDDALGKALDRLHEYGVTELFTVIARQAATRLDLSPKIAHLDTSSFHVDGDYNSNDEEPEDGVIHVKRGYSRDSRPDLYQVVLELIAENQAGLPLMMRPLSGNVSDKSSFQEVVSRHADHLQDAGVEVLVTDSAGYTQGTIGTLEELSFTWVMSVPATLSQAKNLLDGLLVSDFSPLAEGIERANIETVYAGVKQRWLVIRSEAARERARGSAQRQLLKRSEDERKRFDRLKREEFSCEADARAALLSFQASCRVLDVLNPEILSKKHYPKAGRPARDAVAERVTYHVNGVVEASTSSLEEHLERASRFIVATNDTTGEHLSDAEVLAAYKGQSSVERGFRFLKDPMFLASTLFLKKPARVMALLMVMTLCLLVYAAIEHRVRSVLREQGGSVPDQKGKPTDKPTARWVFELFMDVHLLFIVTDTIQVMAMNLMDELQVLLGLLGPAYSEVYS